MVARDDEHPDALVVEARHLADEELMVDELVGRGCQGHDAGRVLMPHSHHFFSEYRAHGKALGEQILIEEDAAG